MIITNLLINMLVVGFNGEIPTNTPAFQQYASDVLLTNAQSIAARLRLDQSSISTTTVSTFRAQPFVDGYSAFAEFGDRYSFWFVRENANNGNFRFSDRAYYVKDVFAETNHNFIIQYNIARKDEDPEESDIDMLAVIAQEGDRERIRAVVRRWTGSKNHLTLRSAQKLAEATVRSLQLIGLRGSPKGKQKEWEDYGDRKWVRPEQLVTGEQGRVLDIHGMPDTGPGVISVVGPYKDGRYLVNYPPKHPSKLLLPYYEFTWKSGETECEVHVCGINSNVVYLHYTGPGMRLPMPSNYFQMLGIATNTVFVERWSPGKFKKYKPK